MSQTPDYVGIDSPRSDYLSENDREVGDEDSVSISSKYTDNSEATLEFPLEQVDFDDVYVFDPTSNELLFEEFKKRQRGLSDTFSEPKIKKQRQKSVSPSFELRDDIESSNVSDGPESDRQSSISENIQEIDWEAFLLEDEMLPPSNWEKEFLKHKEKMLSRYGYKGLFENDEQEEMNSEDQPWYPYDLSEIENLVPDCKVDGVTFVGAQNGESKLCYGMIHNVRVKILPQASDLLKLMKVTRTTLDSAEQQDIYTFKLNSEGDGQKFILQPPDSMEREVQSYDNIAVVNRESSSVLSQIAAYCTFETYSMAEPWTSISSGAAAAEKDHYMFVHIVLYGFQEHLQKVGDILDTRKVYLQEPDFRDMQFDYKNPHFIDLSSINLSTTSDLGPLTSSLLQIDFNFQQQQALDEQGITQALLKQKVMAAFNTTTRAQTLKRVGADSKIRTKLLPYQEEALDFIMQRESGPTPEEYCLWRSDDFVSYKHAITGCEINEIPTETGGGILADEMGLGKTLTMLSAIIGTAAEANTFALSSQNSTHLNVEQNLIHSRATLIVVPSPLLLNEWLEEIKRHCTGFSNITIYHSHGRESNPRVLADSDLILSTYHTIAAESTDKMSPLWQISWYRIVLDEAHVIRRMATKLSKAMRKLHGLLRWCLTGTPIQNSLEDLAALVNFIRSSPLDNLHNFKKHIISPIMRKSESGIENLRKLLDSVCLRRTKELLGLPEIILESQLLSFSISEKKRYIDTRDKLISLINQNSLQPQNRGYLGVFQLQLQLRRLCNHGTFQKPSLGSEEFDPDQAMSLLRKHKRAKCDSCGIKITGIHGIEEQKNGSFTVCGHLLCSSCIPKMKQALRKVDGENSHPQCSLCSETIFAEYIMTEEASSASSARVGRHLSAWQYFDKDGCSTKVSAVVTDIEQNKTDSKSIVFSCWTRSLDLIGIFLTSRKLKFVRIDGSHTIGQRKRILEIYQKDPEIQILLMTTGTGAVGLNLTVASSVYILEPQWNPMVESQAIARVNRLGQTKPVRVIRYIMKDTVEQLELQAQQIRKLEYAKVGWKEDITY